MRSNLTLLRAATVAPSDIDFLFGGTTLFYFKRSQVLTLVATSNCLGEGYLTLYSYHRGVNKIELKSWCPYDQLFVYNPHKDALDW
jgi:hypothetical protein